MECVQYNHRVEITDISPDALSIIKKELKIPYYSFRNGKYVITKTEDLLYKVDDTLCFPPGMLYYLGDILDKDGIDVDLDDRRVPPTPKLKLRAPKQPEPWKNQKEALQAIIDDELGYGFISCLMGTGKTRIIEDIVQLRKVPTIIITPTSSIRDSIYFKLKGHYGHDVVKKEIPRAAKGQNYRVADLWSNTEDDHPEYEYLKDKGFKKVRGQWMKTSKARNDIYGPGKKKNIQKIPQILVICHQSISSLPQEYMDYYEMCIVDEGHTASISSIRHLLNSMPNCYYRYFASATMWRDLKEDFKMLISAIGTNLIYEEPPIEAIEDGRASKPLYTQERAPKPEKPVGYWAIKSNGDLKIVYAKDPDIITKKGIVGNVTRNERIIKIAKNRYDFGRRVLICVNEQAHGMLLQMRFEAAGYETLFVSGGQTTKDEKKQKQEDIELASYGTDPIIVIGTFAIGIGVDTKNIDTVILADLRKGTIRFIQSGGRGSRKKDFTHQFEIVDFYDWFHPTLEKHSKKRYSTFMKYFKSEQGMTRDQWKRMGVKL